MRDEWHGRLTIIPASCTTHRDNLEFLQWIKGFWDTNYPGTPYDPDARRAGVVAAPPPLIGAASVGSARPLPGRGNAVAPAASRAKPSVGARAASGSTGPSAAAARRPGGGSGGKVSSGGVNDQAYQALLAERDDLHAQAEIITSEREFYWHKVSRGIAAWHRYDRPVSLTLSPSVHPPISS